MGNFLSTAAVTRDGPFRFFDLPREIRDNIYLQYLYINDEFHDFARIYDDQLPRLNSHRIHDFVRRYDYQPRRPLTHRIPSSQGRYIAYAFARVKVKTCPHPNWHNGIVQPPITDRFHNFPFRRSPNPFLQLNAQIRREAREICVRRNLVIDTRSSEFVDFGLDLFKEWAEHFLQPQDIAEMKRIVLFDNVVLIPGEDVTLTDISTVLAARNIPTDEIKVDETQSHVVTCMPVFELSVAQGGAFLRVRTPFRLLETQRDYIRNLTLEYRDLTLEEALERKTIDRRDIYDSARFLGPGVAESIHVDGWVARYRTVVEVADVRAAEEGLAIKEFAYDAVVEKALGT